MVSECIMAGRGVARGGRGGGPGASRFLDLVVVEMRNLQLQTSLQTDAKAACQLAVESLAQRTPGNLPSAADLSSAPAWAWSGMKANTSTRPCRWNGRRQEAAAQLVAACPSSRVRSITLSLSAAKTADHDAIAPNKTGASTHRLADSVGGCDIPPAG